MLCALVVSLTLRPLAVRGARLGLPAWLSTFAIVALFGAAIYALIVLLSEPAADLLGRSQDIGATIREKFRFMDRPLIALRELQTAIVGSSGLTVEQGSSVLS